MRTVAFPFSRHNIWESRWRGVARPMESVPFRGTLRGGRGGPPLDRGLRACLAASRARQARSRSACRTHRRQPSAALTGSALLCIARGARFRFWPAPPPALVAMPLEPVRAGRERPRFCDGVGAASLSRRPVCPFTDTCRIESATPHHAAPLRAPRAPRKKAVFVWKAASLTSECLTAPHSATVCRATPIGGPTFSCLSSYCFSYFVPLGLISRPRESPRASPLHGLRAASMASYVSPS